MKRRSALCSAFVLSLFLTSCLALSPPKGMPDVGIPEEALNRRIRLLAPEGLNTFKTNSRIRLVVEVIGSEGIFFPADYGITPFRYDDGEWVQVDEVPTTYARGDGVLPPSQGNILLTGTASTVPILPETDRPVLLRVFVFGRVFRNGMVTDEVEGAYIDVVLRP